MYFSEVVDSLKWHYANKKEMPVGIRVNSSWLEKRAQSNFILRDENSEDVLKKLTGLNVTKDNSVDTYEFIYQEKE